MAGLVPAIHAVKKTWMPGIKPGMTVLSGFEANTQHE
jgi:hypothetical protein